MTEVHPNMTLGSPLQDTWQLISQHQITVLELAMLKKEILQFITVAHGMTLLKSGYHSDSHCDKNLLNNTFAFSLTEMHGLTM